ncbi:hypothetical protein D3C80_1210630 [compost metagenome]
MLVVALPLQLTHKFHHPEFSVGVDLQLSCLGPIIGQGQIPDQRILMRSDKIHRPGRDTAALCLKAGVAHSVGAFPFLGLIQGRLAGRAPVAARLGILNIDVRAGTVHRQMEETVACNPPDLGRLIKSHTAAGM